MDALFSSEVSQRLILSFNRLRVSSSNVSTAMVARWSSAVELQHVLSEEHLLDL